MTKEAARRLFDEKMLLVESKTGRNPKTVLLMSCGPDDAKIFYEQMFACFYSGFLLGKKYSYNI